MLTLSVSALVRVMGPKLWLLSFSSGTPEIVLGESPLMIESGVYLPLSMAAVAVTTLNVDPGGYWPWVARLTWQAMAMHALLGVGWLLS